MGLRTADEYRNGLIDDRRIFYRGEQIENLLENPELAIAVDHSALCYDLSYDNPTLAVCTSCGSAY